MLRPRRHWVWVRSQETWVLGVSHASPVAWGCPRCLPRPQCPWPLNRRLDLMTVFSPEVLRL